MLVVDPLLAAGVDGELCAEAEADDDDSVRLVVLGIAVVVVDNNS